MWKIALASMLLFVGTQPSAPAVEFVRPQDGQTIGSFLTGTLEWQLRPADEGPGDQLRGSDRVRLVVSPSEDMADPIVDVRLPASATSYRIALRPNTRYFWRVVPEKREGDDLRATPRASFVTGSPRIDTTADDKIRYKNPRPGAHYQQMEPIEPGEAEPLSPWFDKKRYGGGPPPEFEEIKDKLPEPLWEGHPEAIAAYWYCWETFCGVWSYAPKEADHQAVSNLIGIPSWGPWGSTMVWDTAFILYFAKYAHHAYPFIEGFDNCYARQHENGFICRESDRENREVYVIYPVNPPLFAWAEWQYYLVSGDGERLRRVFLPIVKHYEWWMVYQRRENGLYWTEGFNEADDSPRNALMHYAVSATSYQALAARYLSKIARRIGRDDMAEYFNREHRELGRLVNRHFWDDSHRIYNDLTKDGRFITELKPGEFCKHCHMFWPLVAEIAPPDRVDGMVAELMNPGSFYRRNGVPSLSADSVGYTGGPDGHGQYWRGAVWPPIQCMVQEGLKQNGRRDLARRLAERYSRAVVETFASQGDITENLAPDRPLACGCGKFVGWGGIGPVANLIEYVLGFDACVPENRITWHVRRTEEHGIKNLWLGGFPVDMVCQKRGTADEPCHLMIRSRGPFTLIVTTGREEREFKVAKGVTQLTLE